MDFGAVPANVGRPVDCRGHGGKDYRVPVGQALGLYDDLQRLDVPVKFLYFADERHAIGAPNHLRIMYETVLNFLDHHVLGEEWRRPALL